MGSVYKPNAFRNGLLRPKHALVIVSYSVMVVTTSASDLSRMNIAERLRDIKVLDPTGAPVRLGDLWQEQPVVLAFIRHFG